MTANGNHPAVPPGSGQIGKLLRRTGDGARIVRVSFGDNGPLSFVESHAPADDAVTANSASQKSGHAKYRSCANLRRTGEKETEGEGPKKQAGRRKIIPKFKSLAHSTVQTKSQGAVYPRPWLTPHLNTIMNFVLILRDH
jgi:hypothetical protein